MAWVAGGFLLHGRGGRIFGECLAWHRVCADDADACGRRFLLKVVIVLPPISSSGLLVKIVFSFSELAMMTPSVSVFSEVPICLAGCHQLLLLSPTSRWSAMAPLSFMGALPMRYLSVDRDLREET